MRSAFVALALFVAVAVSLIATTHESPAATETRASSSTPPIEDLTGKDVGLALGLEPLHWGDEGVHCPTVFAQYDNPVGFCIGPVIDDELEEIILAAQIMGYQRTGVVEAYAAAVVELRHAAADLGAAERIALMGTVSDLAEQLERQGTVED